MLNRRLHDIESLWRSLPNAPYPEMKVGDRVRILYTVQDPVEGIVVSPPDRHGWVKVKQKYYGDFVEFVALASHCEVLS